MRGRIIQIIAATPGTIAVYKRTPDPSIANPTDRDRTTYVALPCLCLVEHEDGSGTFVDGYDRGKRCSEYTNFVELRFKQPSWA